MKKSNMLFLFFITIFFSCKKESADDLPKEPSIELISINPTNVEQFKDSVIIIIKYKDNDGDLGDVSHDEYSLYVKDSRLPEPDWYHISPLAPIDHTLKIEGELKIKLNSMFLIGNGTEEMATLTIKLKDRAQNWSNEIVTPAITVNDTL